MPRPRKLVIPKIICDKEANKLEGTWVSESQLKYPVINYNCDVYYKEDDGTEKLLLKFRKKSFTNSQIRNGWKSYKDLAKPSRGRGASAGPIDTESIYWKKRNIINTSKWSTGYLNPVGNNMKDELSILSVKELQDKVKEMKLKIKEEDINDKDSLMHSIIKKNGGISKMKVNNQVASNPIGYYESSKNFSVLPCRLTHFTRTNYKKYMDGLDFIKHIDNMFKTLIPDSYEKQLERSNQKPHLKIPDTCFSTITINRNFRTAVHKDAGDFRDGFGNLTVIERGKYHGGYTVFPQFGVGVDVRSGDFLAMDVHQWHSNTPIYETKEDKDFNDKLEKVYNDNPQVGTVGLDKNYTRLTFVCYLREKILDCPTEIDERFLGPSGHGKIV